MIHLVYLDNKEKVLEKIMSGKKTMIIRGAAGRKIPHSRVFNDEVLYLSLIHIFELIILENILLL